MFGKLLGLPVISAISLFYFLEMNSYSMNNHDFSNIIENCILKETWNDTKVKNCVFMPLHLSQNFMFTSRKISGF